MGATKNVLETYELLEHILLYIPCFQLLTAMRCVSKNWRSVVDTSIQLRWATWRHSGSDDPFQKKPNRAGDEISQFLPGIAENNESDRGRIQQHLFRRYELNPLAPMIFRTFWKRLVTAGSVERDLSGETVTSVATRFIDSIESLGLYFTRPVLENITLFFHFTDNLIRPQDRSLNAYIYSALPAQRINTNLKERINVDSKLGDILRLLYFEVISSLGWDLIMRTGESRLKMSRERTLVETGLRNQTLAEDDAEDQLPVETEPEADSIYPQLGIVISSREGRELAAKYFMKFSSWAARMNFVCIEPWIVEISVHPPAVQVS